jgi:DNA-binding transcriptional MerR regulator
MKFYSTGETAKRLGVTRDSLHAALRTTAPDAATRIGNRRVFTEDEVGRLASWFERRRKRRDCPWQLENEEEENSDE